MDYLIRASKTCFYIPESEETSDESSFMTHEQAKSLFACLVTLNEQAKSPFACLVALTEQAKPLFACLDVSNEQAKSLFACSAETYECLSQERPYYTKEGDISSSHL
jgi:hypothetical protein